tara:strand:- start:3397 stop:3639 length:243 start_codon:yes stop_codon:yes gene_type:complete
MKEIIVKHEKCIMVLKVIEQASHRELAFRETAEELFDCPEDDLFDYRFNCLKQAETSLKAKNKLTNYYVNLMSNLIKGES